MYEPIAPEQELTEITLDVPEEEGIDGYLEGLLDSGNIVDEIQDNTRVANRILNLYQTADQSMNNWRKKYKRALSLAKLQPMAGDTEINHKSFPFENASLAMLPFVTEAMIDFNSRAAPELVWSDNIVNAKVYGKKTDEKEARAKRVSKYENYQLMEGMPNWRDEQDKMLLILPGPGTAYKRTYYDYDRQQVRSDLHLADEVIFDMSFKSFYEAPDKFMKLKYTRNEVLGFIRGEQGWQVNEDELDEDKEDFEFLEAYTWVDLDDDGLKEPYTAIIWEQSGKIVALYPYYDEDTINYNEDEEVISVDSLDCFTQYRFLPDPAGGPMGLGWGILFGPTFDSVNTTVRQLIDAGTLSNTSSNSGLIAMDTTSGRGNSVQSGPVQVKMGQLTPVNVRGGNLSQSVVQFPFAGPNQTLFNLMESLVQSARGITSSANIDPSPNEAAAMHLARLQQGLKIPNSIIMRVYSAAKKEKQKIGLLNFKHFDDELYNKILDEEQEHSMQADFNPKDCDITIAVDPAQGSSIERVQRAEAVLMEAKTQPQQILNLRQAYLNWLEAIDAPDIEELAPEPDPNAVDPGQQMAIAQMQMEAELKQKDQELRANAQRLQEQKLAHEASKTMISLGLEADEKEAKIASIYIESLTKLVDAGIASSTEQAISVIDAVENRFIDAEGGTDGRSTEGQIPPSNPQPVGDMAG